MSLPNHFELLTTDGAARTGVLRTAHGELRTPAFMPVGTKATVKAVDPDELRLLGAEILLCNTYHLHFRPGAGLIAELGGLHRFMAWDGPILTDSGGYQVFSLRDTITRVDDDGVTFRSVYDGASERFTPESVAAIQAKLGSDIAMCLDVCAPAGSDDLAEAVRLTTVWAKRQREAPRAEGQLLFGIAQGATDAELRRHAVHGFEAVERVRPRRRREAVGTGARDPAPLRQFDVSLCHDLDAFGHGQELLDVIVGQDQGHAGSTARGATNIAERRYLEWRVDWGRCALS